MKKLTPRSLFVGVLAIAAAAMIVNACAESGQVLERGTNKPLAGVFVIAEWRGNIPNPVQSHTSCYHAAVTETDSEGRFRISAMSGNVNPFIIERTFSVYLYKPGYAESFVGTEERGIKYMALRVGPQAERFQTIADMRLGSSCDEDKKSFLPARKAKAFELEQLAETEKQREFASRIRFSVDLVEFGEAIAEENLKRRELELTKAQAKGVVK